jgi:Uma2 family endonuclease
MPAVAEKRVTPEAMLALNDGKRYELVDGQLVEKAMGYVASRIAALIFLRLELYLDKNPIGNANCDAWFKYPWADDLEKCRVRAPDASVVLNGRFQGGQLPTGFAEVVPDLAVEVVSPNDSYYEVNRKAAEYLAAGAQEVWLVDPDCRHIEARRKGTTRTFQMGDVLTSPELLPGFEMQLADLFKNTPA